LVTTNTSPLKVSVFGDNRSDLEGVTPELVGFKAFNLMRMDSAGLPVPPGFVLHTGLSRVYRERGNRLPAEVTELIREQIRALEAATGLFFGDARRPLLVSVRSGASVSMPGMLDTLLNVGLTDSTVQGLIRRTGNPHLAWDSYRRLVAAYTEIVGGVRGDFESLLQTRLAEDGLHGTELLSTRALHELTAQSLASARSGTGASFPQDPVDQLLGAVEAVFRSWDGERAVAYRKLHGLEHVCGTAVIVQAMVFGNAGGTSGSGVGFTRNPATGADELYFDFAFDAQGEDVVAGRHGPTDPLRLARVMPSLYAELLTMRRALERQFGDMQDFEFTVEDGILYMLQTRPGKRTPLAAVRIAVAMADEGLIEPGTALEWLAGIDPLALRQERLETGSTPAIANALPASPGVAVGPIALDSAAAIAAAAAGTPAILVRAETSTEDIEGFAAAAGILTATGGRTSHAAVVARQMGKVCLVACPALEIDLESRACTIGGQRLAEGAAIALDGNDGGVYAGRITVVNDPSVEDIEAIERLRRQAAAADAAARLSST
jgi:pyruvate,orthophosphate dikinase